MIHLPVFFTACFVLAMTPGPGLMYVLARATANGREDGLRSAVGTFLGGMFHVLAASLGLSALLVASAIAFSVVKYAGAAYLIFLGIRMILSRSDDALDSGSTIKSHALKQGVWTEVLNPKTALFFLSFIPQFVSAVNGHLFVQFLCLGCIAVCMNTAADVAVVLLAAPIAERLARSASLRRKQRMASGVGMIGLGVYVAGHD